MGKNNYKQIQKFAEQNGGSQEDIAQATGTSRGTVRRAISRSTLAKSTARRVLIIPDIHCPDHDEMAIKVMLDFKRDWKPHETIMLGDLINADAVTIHAKGRMRLDQLEEYEQARDLLDRIRPDVLLEGNHEERFRRPGNVPWELWKLLEPQRWFEVKERGIRWVPYSNRHEDVYRIGKLSVIHGFRIGEYAAKAEAAAFGCVVHGHTHRLQTFQPRHAFESHTGFNIGCLCNLDLSYQRTGPPRGWAQGFAYFYVYRSGQFSAHVFRMIGNEFIEDGRYYRR